MKKSGGLIRIQSRYGGQKLMVFFSGKREKKVVGGGGVSGQLKISINSPIVFLQNQF